MTAGLNVTAARGPHNIARKVLEERQRTRKIHDRLDMLCSLTCPALSESRMTQESVLMNTISTILSLHSGATLAAPPLKKRSPPFTYLPDKGALHRGYYRPESLSEPCQAVDRR